MSGMNDTYRVLQTIASGGTAVLYKAIQTSLDRTVVIKRLHAHLLSDPDFARRFRIEAKAAALLDHENIVRIIDFGTFEGDSAIVMEYIDGPSLKEILSTRRVLEAETTMLIAREICLGLDHAHRHGVIHRDIKPANILISKDGRVKIADFGLAKLFRPDAQETIASTLLGTPLYMAPEQAAGETLDGRADLFSLGAICYEALTGSKPFSADSYAAVIEKILHGKIVHPSRLLKDLRPDIEAIVMKALARDPEDRYPSAKTMAEAIESVIGEESILSSKEQIASLAQGNAIPLSGFRTRSRQRRKTVVSFAAIAAVAAISVLAMQGLLLRIMPDSLSRVGSDPSPAPVAASFSVKPQDINGLKMIPVEDKVSAEKESYPDLAPVLEEKTSEILRDTMTSPLDDSTDANVLEIAAESNGADSESLPAAKIEIPQENESKTDVSVTGEATASSFSSPRMRIETGYLELVVEPAARIAIDGEQHAHSGNRISIELAAGSHEISCSREGYRDYIENLRIYKGEMTRRRITLQEITGSLEILSEQGALLIVDGYAKGYLPLDKPLTLSPGRHRIELRKVGRTTWSSEVYIAPEETLRLSIELVPLLPTR